MDCDRCSREAITDLPYEGSHLCGEHLAHAVERRVTTRVREDNLIPRTATPDDPVTWVIGLSGGKDSVVLTDILHATFCEDPRVELVALSIDEGIADYRARSLAAARELVEARGIHHEVVRYESELDLTMDEVVAADPAGMAACSYCGVFRRTILERYGADLGADLLLTGHNLDDEVQTAMMNYLEGDVEQMARHYEASLAPLDERSEGPFTPRAKPLRDVPEREVALYAHVRDLPAHVDDCPHASESFRAEIQTHVHDLESGHPGTRQSLLSGYLELSTLAAAAVETSALDVMTCSSCGAPASHDPCRACSLSALVREAL